MSAGTKCLEADAKAGRELIHICIMCKRIERRIRECLDHAKGEDDGDTADA